MAKATTKRWSSVVALALATACYGGKDRAGEPTAGDGDGDGAEGGDGGGEDGSTEGPDARLEARIWRLSSAQFRNEVTSLFGPEIPAGTIPDGATEQGISNIASIDGVDVGNVSVVDDVVRQIASYVADNGPTASRCGDSYGQDACVDEFLGWALPAAFRRPATPDEVTSFRELFDANAAEHGYDYGFSSVVRALLLSPQFLYRTEVGPPGSSGTVTMTDHEIAAAIAFAMTDRAPDTELRNAADAGTLIDPDERERHVRRLMDASAGVWQRTFREWLGLTRLATAAEGIGIEPDLVAQMDEEFETFVREVIVAQRGSLHDLLGADYTWAQPGLAQLYGASHPGAGLERINLDPSERAGLLTQPAWLTSHATIRDDYVVRRGMGIYRDAFCNEIVPPDIDVEEENAKLVDPDATVRDVVEARGTEPRCSGCHQIPDPVGFAFEAYDNRGQVRGSYADGNPVETDVEVPNVGPVAGAPELARALADNASFQRCFVRRFTHVFVGHDMGDPTTRNWTDESWQAWLDAELSFEEFLVAFVRHEAFIERVKGAE